MQNRGRIYRRAVAIMVLLVAPWWVAAQERDFVIGINAGVSAGEELHELRRRFHGLGEVFSHTLKRKARVEPLYSSLVASQLERDSYPVFVVHTHHALRAALSGKYELVALAQPVSDDRVAFIADGKSEVKALGDLKGRNVVMPAEFSFLSVAARSVLRAQKVDIAALQVKYVSQQEAVTWIIENGLGDVGVTRSTKYIAKWRGAGGKIVFESEPVSPYALIVSKKVAPAVIEQVRAAVAGMGESEAGRAALADIGTKGFLATEPGDIRKLTEWFGIR